MNRKVKIIILVLVVLLLICLGFNKKFKTNNEKIVSPLLGDVGGGILFSSNVIDFSNSNIANKTARTAFDELYDSIMDGCAAGYERGTGNSYSYVCNKITQPANQTLEFSANNVRYNNSTSGLTATNVSDALTEIAAMIPNCKVGFHKTNETSSSYNCISNTPPVTLRVTADDKTMTYGESAPLYSYTVNTNDLVNGDTANVVSGNGSYTIMNGDTVVSNVSTANAGTYSIVLDGLSVTGNYAIQYIAGSLTINKITPTMTLSTSNVSLGCGGSTTVTVTSPSDGTIGCSTSNSSVATCSVNNNIVTIVAASSGGSGSATITISQGASTNYNAPSNKTVSVSTSGCTIIYNVNCECDGNPYHSPTNGNSCKVQVNAGVSCYTWCNQRCKAKYGNSYTGHIVSCSESSGTPTCNW